MGRPPSKFVTHPRHAVDEEKRKRKSQKKVTRTDYFERSDLVPLMQSWLLGHPDAGAMDFYRWYASNYDLGPPGQIGDTEMERVRQLFRDAQVRARKAGWLKDGK
jgi:hypothetical protein